MDAIETLKNRSDFLGLRSAKRFHSGSFILQAKRNPAQETIRVGYTVTRKTGNAVVRNRIKRRLREAVRISFPQYGRPGHDYVLIGKAKAVHEKFDRIVNDLNTALDRMDKMGAKASQRRGKSDSNTLNQSKHTEQTDLS